MRKKVLAVLAAAMAFTVLAATPALADIVGEPGTPSCFGERISHGSADHELTPAERAPLLEQFIVAPALAGDFGPEIQAFAEEFFGTDGVNVQETIRWIRANCSDEPIVG